MKQLGFGILIGLSFPLLSAYLFISLGGMPVATKGPPLPLERWVVKTALRAAIKKDLKAQAPFELAADRVNHASRLYQNNCGGCHGIQNQDNLMAKAMFPPAPQFFRPNEDVKDDPVGKIYWKIKNGIRLTGMPSYADILSETEIWEVSLFLKNGYLVKQTN